MSILSQHTLNVNLLLEMADPAIVQRGQTYYREGRARIQHLDSQSALLRVLGSRVTPYVVEARFVNDKVSLTCDCAYSEGNPNILCKHKIAAALALNYRLLVDPPITWKNILATAMQQTSARRAVTPVTPRMVLLFSLFRDAYGWRVTPYTLATKYLPEDAQQDTAAIMQAIKTHHLEGQARPIRTRTDYSGFTNITSELVAAVSLLTGTNNYSQRDVFDTLLPMLADSPIFVGTTAKPFKDPLTIASEDGEFTLELTETPEGMRLAAAVTLNGQPYPLKSSQTEMISERPVWMLAGSTLFRLNSPIESIRPFLSHREIDIPREDAEEFLEKFLLPLAERVPLHGDGISWEEIDVEPSRRVYLTEAQGELHVQLCFAYNEFELTYDPLLPAQSIQRKPGTTTLLRINRRPEMEDEASKTLVTFGLKRDTHPGWFLLRKGTEVADLLLRHVPRMQQAGFQVFGEEALTLVKVNRLTPTLSLTVSSQIDWFDIQGMVNFGELEVSLKEIRRALRKREQYVKLPDGSIGYLPDEWVTRFRHLFGMGEEAGEGVRLAKSQVMLLDALLSNADQSAVDAEFEQRRGRLRDFSRIAEHPLPQGFVGELRHYQQAGYNWLHFLHEYGLGGCLADDMGIGKTVQTLTFLLSLRESGEAKHADLVVVPRSLLYNWERESARFTPGLRVYLHSEQDRLQEPEQFNDYDLVLTTYGVMLRDLEMLREYRFHYLVLDESQTIKNPLSQTAKAVRLLHGDHRLVLTGTPVENTTVDLWSQFSFLNPGLLGSLDYFRTEFATPIEKKQDEEAARLLRAVVYPFILRRTKEQVETELPPRTERILYCEMEPAQRKLYTRVRDYYRGLLLGMIDGEGLNNARMHVLEGLLRLRQICNHPRLVDRNYKGESAKFEMLLETVDTLRAEGHKALVFSQFTQMLQLVRETLDARSIPYLYLDGQTKDRQERVDAFQQETGVPFFLISLKAGGVGLNLTAADYVIHIDPWWNPAVERQATDRTHRIGQDKPVFVYKLIAGDSVEEKILLLQERKQNMVQQLISSETSFLKSLTRQDVEILFS